MNINQLYSGGYLKAADIKGHNVTAIIDSLTLEKIGEDGDKPVLHFVGKDKGLVLNKTNASMIAHFYGDETDHWIGKQIGLTVEPVSFQGKIVDAIRVKVTNDMMTPQPNVQAPANSSAISPGCADSQDIPW